MPQEKNITELDLITVLFFHASSFHAYMLRLESEFFSEKYQCFFEVMQKHYKAYGKVPAQSVYKIELDPEDKKEALVTWDEVYANYEKTKHLSHDYLLDKFDNFSQGCFLKRFLVNSYDLYARGDYKKIRNQISRLNDAIIDNNLGQEFHEDSFIDKRYGPSSFGSYVNTGFSTFDDVFGGWYRKALHVIAGPSNSGKTLWLINFVANLLLNQEQTGLKILYITLEIDEEQVGRRLDACLLETPMTEVAQFRDQKLRELISESKETKGNRLIIKEMPGYKTTPADIEAMMRNLDITSEGELKPDIVIVDYIGLLSPSVVHKNMGLYEKGLSLAVELRSIAQRYDIPMIVAAQTNRDSFSDRVGQDKISDSIGIAQTCDMLLTINRNDELDAKDQANIYMAKSRFCKNGDIYLFQVLYDCMRVDEIVGGTASGETETGEEDKDNKEN